MQKISIDLGYGHTKVVTNKKEFKFPTAVAIKPSSMADYANDGDDVYVFDGKKYIVGKNAVVNAAATRGFNFLIKYSALLIYHSIKLAGLDTTKPIEVITALSIINWNEKEAFLDAIKTINVNNEIIEPKITLFAQGEGAYNDAGKGDGITAIVDVGYNTFDFLVFESEKNENIGKPRPDISFATKNGANKIITELQNQIKKKYKCDITEQAAIQIFTDGYLMNFGQKEDLSDTIKELKEYYTEFILDELRSQRIEVLRTANKVVFSGGGAYFLSGDMPANCCFSKKPYEFANSRGAYNECINKSSK